MDALVPGHQGALCLNCGTALVGAYCHACGQEAGTGRVTWGTLLRENYRALLRLDSEILRAARALTNDPGGFCRQYLEGRRRGVLSVVRARIVRMGHHLRFGGGPSVGR